MTHLFQENGIALGVTVIEAAPNTVTQVKTEEKDGYTAVQLGFGEARRLNAPEKGHLKKLAPLQHLREFSASKGSEVKVGQQFDVSLFKAGDLVDVAAVSKGKGFAGTVKRHHFAGGPKTHGQSDRHRAPGAVGATTTPGRVFKGLRMAGRMGNHRVSVRNIEVARVDPDRNLLLLNGAVPGARGALVMIKKVQVKARERVG